MGDQSTGQRSCPPEAKDVPVSLQTLTQVMDGSFLFANNVVPGFNGVDMVRMMGFIPPTGTNLNQLTAAQTEMFENFMRNLSCQIPDPSAASNTTEHTVQAQPAEDPAVGEPRPKRARYDIEFLLSNNFNSSSTGCSSISSMTPPNNSPPLNQKRNSTQCDEAFSQTERSLANALLSCRREEKEQVEQEEDDEDEYEEEYEDEEYEEKEEEEEENESTEGLPDKKQEAVEPTVGKDHSVPESTVPSTLDLEKSRVHQENDFVVSPVTSSDEKTGVRNQHEGMQEPLLDRMTTLEPDTAIKMLPAEEPNLITAPLHERPVEVETKTSLQEEKLIKNVIDVNDSHAIAQNNKDTPLQQRPRDEVAALQDQRESRDCDLDEKSFSEESAPVTDKEQSKSETEQTPVESSEKPPATSELKHEEEKKLEKPTASDESQNVSRFGKLLTSGDQPANVSDEADGGKEADDPAASPAPLENGENNENPLDEVSSEDEEEEDVEAPGEESERWLEVLMYQYLIPGVVVPLNLLYNRLKARDQARKKEARKRAKALRRKGLSAEETEPSAPVQQDTETEKAPPASSEPPGPSSSSSLPSVSTPDVASQKKETEVGVSADKKEVIVKRKEEDVFDIDKEIAILTAKSSGTSSSSDAQGGSDERKQRKCKSMVPPARPTRRSARIKTHAERLEQDEVKAAVAAVEAVKEAEKAAAKTSRDASKVSGQSERSGKARQTEQSASLSKPKRKRGRPPALEVSDEMDFAEKQLGRTVLSPDIYARKVGEETSQSLLKGVHTPTPVQDCVILDHFRSPVVRRAIRNRSTLCYAISIIQIMMRVPQIYSITKCHQHDTNPSNNNACFMCLLAKLISTKPKHDEDYQTMIDVMNATWAGVNLTEMQCVMDTMQRFFTQFDREFMAQRPQYAGIRETEFSPVRSFFEINILNNLKCTTCPYSYQYTDTAIYITVDLTKNCKDMQSFVDSMKNSTVVMEKACPRCQSTTFTCSQSFKKLPDVLLYYVPRVLVNVQEKDATVVHIKKRLKLRDSVGEHKYDLCSFITHLGDFSNKGHYKSYEVDRSGHDMLNEFNDGYVIMNSTLPLDTHLVLAMFRKPEAIAKDHPTDIIFDGRGNVVYALEKYFGPQKSPFF